VVEFFYPRRSPPSSAGSSSRSRPPTWNLARRDDGSPCAWTRPQGLFERGDNEVGPYQSPMEDGMQHFHEWYRETMGPRTALD
jgi:choline monooxygenase